MVEVVAVGAESEQVGKGVAAAFRYFYHVVDVNCEDVPAYGVPAFVPGLCKHLKDDMVRNCFAFWSHANTLSFAAIVLRPTHSRQRLAANKDTTVV